MRQALIFACYVAATGLLFALVAIGCLLKLLYREPPPEAKSWNCWAFAVPKFLQSEVESGLLVSCSRHARAIPHVRFVPCVDGVRYEEAVPAAPRKGWRAIFDAVKFRAVIRKVGP